MQSINFSPEQFVDAATLNYGSALVSGSVSTICSGAFIPGLIRPDVAVIAVSGLTSTATLPVPFAALFGTGIYAQAHGTQTGADTQSYSASLAGVVPASGSVTAYLVASYQAIQQTAVQIIGPPVGHPDYNPNYVPVTAYEANVDSIAVSGTTTAPDGVSTFELARWTVAAGATGLAAPNTNFQPRAAALNTVPPLQVSGNTALAVTQAGHVIQATAACTITLQPVASANGCQTTIQSTTSGTVTVQTYEGTANIYGARGSASTPVIRFNVPQGDSVTLLLVNGRWGIIGGSAGGLGLSTTFTDSGAANAYVLTSSGPFALTTGSIIQFQAVAANTTAATATLNGAGPYQLTLVGTGSGLPGGAIQATPSFTTLRYNGTTLDILPTTDAALKWSAPQVFGSNITVGGGLSVTGNASIGGNETVSGTMSVGGAVTIGGASTLTGAVTASSNMTVVGNETVSGSLDVVGSETVSGSLLVSTNETVSGTMSVGGATTLTGAVTASSTLAVAGSETVTGSLTVSTNETVVGTMSVGGAVTIGGASTLTGAVTASSNMTVVGNETVSGSLDVVGSETVSGSLLVSTNETVSGTMSVGGATTLTGAVTASNNLSVGGSETVTGSLTVSTNETVSGTMSIGGAATITGASTLTGAVTASNNLTIGGSETVSGSLDVIGNETVAGSLTVSTNETVSGTMSVGGATTLTGAVTASSTLAVSGNETVSGTLNVGGASTLSGAVTASSTANISGNATVGGGTGLTVNNQVGVAATPGPSIPLTIGTMTGPNVLMNNDGAGIACNLYFDGVNWHYVGNGYGYFFQCTNGTVTWYFAGHNVGGSGASATLVIGATTTAAGLNVPEAGQIQAQKLAAINSADTLTIAGGNGGINITSSGTLSLAGTTLVLTGFNFTTGLTPIPNAILHATIDGTPVNICCVA